MRCLVFQAEPFEDSSTSSDRSKKNCLKHLGMSSISVSTAWWPLEDTYSFFKTTPSDFRSRKALKITLKNPVLSLRYHSPTSSFQLATFSFSIHLRSSPLFNWLHFVPTAKLNFICSFFMISGPKMWRNVTLTPKLFIVHKTCISGHCEIRPHQLQPN